MNAKDLKFTITGTEGQSIKQLLKGFDDRFEKLVEEIHQNTRVKDKILDIGCGEGKIWELFPDLQVTGLDFSQENLKKAKKFVKPVLGSAEKLPFKDNSFDIVLATEILEHVINPEKLLTETDRVLKRGGHAIISFPNTAALQLRIGISLFGRSPLLNYPQNVGHIRFFDLSDIRKMLKDTKLRIKKIRGGNFLSFHSVNFGSYIPVPRKIRFIGGDIFPTLSLGCIVVLKKQYEVFNN